MTRLLPSLLGCVALVALPEAAVVFPLRTTPVRRRLGGEYPANATAGIQPLGGHGMSSSSGSDYYFTTLQLGTPPRPFDLIIDTGSSLAYVPCEHTCYHCGHHNHPPLIEDSKTYRELGCDDQLCSWKNTCKNQKCTYSKHYMEGSGVDGDLVEDNITLLTSEGTCKKDGQDVAQNDRLGEKPLSGWTQTDCEKTTGAVFSPSTEFATPIVFGCTASETRLIYSQAVDGVMGITRDPQAIPSQLANNHITEDIFSICMARRRDGHHDGHFVMGGTIAAGDGGDKLMWVPMVPREKTQKKDWYIVAMDSVEVGGTKLKAGPEKWNSRQYGGAMIDTGTTDMMLPRPLFNLFNNAVVAHLEKNGYKYRHYYGPGENMCFVWQGSTSVADAYLDHFPDFAITFFNGVRLQLHSFNYVHNVGGSTQCMNVYTNSAGVMLGSATMLDVLMVFDRKNDRLGFAPSTCSDPEPYSGKVVVTSAPTNTPTHAPTRAPTQAPTTAPTESPTAAIKQRSKFHLENQCVAKDRIEDEATNKKCGELAAKGKEACTSNHECAWSAGLFSREVCRRNDGTDMTADFDAREKCERAGHAWAAVPPINATTKSPSDAPTLPPTRQDQKLPSSSGQKPPIESSESHLIVIIIVISLSAVLFLVCFVRSMSRLNRSARSSGPTSPRRNTTTPRSLYKRVSTTASDDPERTVLMPAIQMSEEVHSPRALSSPWRTNAESGLSSRKTGEPFRPASPRSNFEDIF